MNFLREMSDNNLFIHSSFVFRPLSIQFLYNYFKKKKWQFSSGIHENGDSSMEMEILETL